MRKANAAEATLRDLRRFMADHPTLAPHVKVAVAERHLALLLAKSNAVWRRGRQLRGFIDGAAA